MVDNVDRPQVSLESGLIKIFKQATRVIALALSKIQPSLSNLWSSPGRFTQADRHKFGFVVVSACSLVLLGGWICSFSWNVMSTLLLYVLLGSFTFLVWFQREPTHHQLNVMFKSMEAIRHSIVSLESSIARNPVAPTFVADVRHSLPIMSKEVPPQRESRETLEKSVQTVGQPASLIGELDAVMKNIDELAVLCHDLIASGILEDFSASAVVVLARAVITKFSLNKRGQLSDQVIECLREAYVHLPDLQPVSYAFAYSLGIRFMLSYSNDDYKEATIILDRDIASRHPGDSSDTYLGRASALVAMIAYARSIIYGNPECLEESISRIRTALSLNSLPYSLRPAFTQVLESGQKRRSEVFGVTGSLEEWPSSDLGVSSLLYLATSVAKLNGDLSVTSVDDDGQSQNIETLLSVGHLDGIVDIEEAIKSYRMLLDSFNSSDFTNYAVSLALAQQLLRAFKLTYNIQYLDESIAIFRDILKMPVSRAFFLPISRRLIASISSRFSFLSRREDLDEIMQLFPKAVNDSHARVPDRFEVSCEWAQAARNNRHPSILSAYDIAMSLMQDSLTFAPTLDVQQSRLIAMRDRYKKLPLDYASYLVDEGQVERAIETLDQGRTLIWSQIHGFRTPVDQIFWADPSLAGRFAAVNRELETLTLSASPIRNIELEDPDARGHKWVDPFGQLVLEQRKLLEARDGLISSIRALPGFESFFKAPQFDTLRSAASQGPVIIINNCEWRSDIIIVLHNSPPSLITTTSDFYERANELRDRLVNARQDHGIDSTEYEDALRTVLNDLYDLVGEPVLQRLRALNIPEQSRVWWCPTSAFCSLPLHAMGPIPSENDNDVKRYFMDLYIPSYTTSLSALIESHRVGSKISEKPSILLVAPLSERLPGISEEIEVIRSIGWNGTTLIAETATPTTVMETLRDHRFAHFACSGKLKTGKPFDTSFELNGGEHLTLLEIIRSRLPVAEFAFLSADYTAAPNDESIDESLNLTVAMQICGFRSVVGTMWMMVDMDGPDLAKYFYKSILSGRKEEVHYYERSAKALRKAVQKLRRKRGITLERWVNYVHYGA
ncbi:CHAT domain-containing protein [Multifurca ochricompacta]|uniref:CHAT domain-containing protein n=1 Tax=Multifurca ochricompacta TaxID=376703 RepID=A0AAD4QJH8_9AGAM|nr:CHAT domain-containing protein [Multifurca ochricompacta]